jgi:hypothetical protein
VVDGVGAFVGGGGYDGSTTAGNQALAPASTIGGGYGNLITSTASYATVGGGSINTASGQDATVGGGAGNTASGKDATVGGGSHNTASGQSAVVGGGGAYVPGFDLGNTASGDWSTVGGGWDNTATMTATTIGGGESNLVTATYGTIGGGRNITVTGDYAAVPGGANNAAQGNYSFAAGRQATAAHNGSFVWSDSGSSVTSQRNDQFLVQANGGALFQDRTGLWVEMVWDTSKPISTSTGAYLSSGGTWTNSSDRNKKENFEPVDEQDVLARLAEIPITTWNFKAEDPSVRHLGPMAQDFYAAFGLGDSDTSIGTLDADGVSLAAIQALHEQNQALQAENAELRDRVDGLEARLSALEEQVNGEAAPSPTSSRFLPSGWAGLLALATVAGVWAWRRG